MTGNRGKFSGGLDISSIGGVQGGQSTLCFPSLATLSHLIIVA
jgi:hypothetical protein